MICENCQEDISACDYCKKDLPYIIICCGVYSAHFCDSDHCNEYLGNKVARAIESLKEVLQ